MSISPPPQLQIMPKAQRIYLHATFETLEEFRATLDEWCAENYHPFRVASSELLRESDGLPNEKCCYRYLVYHCAHYGHPRKRGTGKRPNQNYMACGCTATIRINYSYPETCLKITTLKIDHINHEVSADTYQQYLTKINKTPATPTPARKPAKRVSASSSTNHSNDSVNSTISAMIFREPVETPKSRKVTGKNVRRSLEHKSPIISPVDYSTTASHSDTASDTGTVDDASSAVHITHDGNENLEVHEVHEDCGDDDDIDVVGLSEPEPWTGPKPPPNLPAPVPQYACPNPMYSPYNMPMMMQPCIVMPWNYFLGMPSDQSMTPALSNSTMTSLLTPDASLSSTMTSSAFSTAATVGDSDDDVKPLLPTPPVEDPYKGVENKENIISECPRVFTTLEPRKTSPPVGEVAPTQSTLTNYATFEPSFQNYASFQPMSAFTPQQYPTLLPVKVLQQLQPVQQSTPRLQNTIAMIEQEAMHGDLVMQAEREADLHSLVGRWRESTSS